MMMSFCDAIVSWPASVPLTFASPLHAEPVHVEWFGSELDARHGLHVHHAVARAGSRFGARTAAGVRRASCAGLVTSILPAFPELCSMIVVGPV